MAIPGTVPVAGPIAPTAVGDTYPSFIASYGLDDSAVASFADLALIPAPRLAEGMERFAILEQAWYQLAADLTTWNLSRNTALPTDVMLKSVYDPNDDGIVTNSDQLQGQNGAYYLARANHTGTQAQATITNLAADLALKEDKANKGVANGYVPLNAGVTIDPIYLPVASPIDPVLPWDVITNTPALADGGAFSAGEAYIVTTSANPTARDLGSGSQNWSDGDLAIYTATNIFIRVPRAGVGVTQITTDAGVVNGAVTLNDTSYIAPQADRQYVTADQLAGIAASPNAVTAANPVATQADLTSLIVVGNGFFMPELFNDGHTLGDGTKRILNTLNATSTGVPYTNVSAGNYWTRVNSAYTIDVTVMDIDWIAHQEAMLAMLQDGYSKMITPGGRGYCPYGPIYLPTDQAAVAAARRSQMFIFDFCGSTYNNVTGTSFPIFNKYPANQADANGFRLDYQFFFSNARFYGNDSTNETDCFIKIGGTNMSSFEKIHGSEMGMLIDAQFCLQVTFREIRVESYGKYGIAVRDGLWTGAGANTAQSNNADIFKLRAYNGTGKTPAAAIYNQGNRNVNILSSAFEGDNGAVTHILYDQAYPPSGTLAGTVKNTLYMESLDFENAGASRAGIQIKGNNIYTELNRYNTQVSAANMAVLLEAYAINGVNGGQSLYIHGANNYNPGYKFRQITSGGPTHKWYVEKVDLINNASLVNAANWDTAFAGSSIPTNVQYTAVL